MLFVRQRQSSFNQSMSLWVKFRYNNTSTKCLAPLSYYCWLFSRTCVIIGSAVCEYQGSSNTYPVLLQHILLSGVEKAFVCAASRYQSTTLSCRPPRHHYVRPCQELRGRAQLAVVRVDSGCQVNHVLRVPRAPNPPSPSIAARARYTGASDSRLLGIFFLWCAASAAGWGKGSLHTVLWGRREVKGRRMEFCACAGLVVYWWREVSCHRGHASSRKDL